MKTKFKLILLIAVLATSSAMAQSNYRTLRMSNGSTGLTQSPILISVVSMCQFSNCYGYKEVVAAAKEDAAFCVANGCELENMPLLNDAISALREQKEFASLSDSDLTLAIAVMNQDKE